MARVPAFNTGEVWALGDALVERREIAYTGVPYPHRAMSVTLPTVRCLSRINAAGTDGIPAPVGTAVTLEGYLSDVNGGDGGGATFSP